MSRRRRGGDRGTTVLVAHPGAELYGSDRVFLESVSAYVGAGWRVVAALPERGPLVRELEARGARVVIVPTPVLRKSALRPLGLVRLGLDGCRGVWHGTRLIRAVRPTLVYVSTVTIPLWSVLGRLLRCQVLVHVHEAEGSARTLVRKLLAAPLLAADRILVNSEFSLSVLTRAVPALGDRSTVLYNGVVGPDEHVPPRGSVDGPLGLLYVGRLSPRKGVDLAVAAAGLLVAEGCAVTLDIVGAVFPGYEWYEAELREAARRAGVADVVRFHGFRTDVWRFLAECDVALVPSRVDEPFGNTAVEAVLAARPLVVSATSGLREAAAGYGCVRFVTPGDARGLADAVHGIREAWSSVSAQAIEDAALADERHSPARYRSRFLEIVAAMQGASRE